MSAYGPASGLRLLSRSRIYLGFHRHAFRQHPEDSINIAKTDLVTKSLEGEKQES